MLLFVRDTALAEEFLEGVVEVRLRQRLGSAKHLQRCAMTAAEEVGKVGGGEAEGGVGVAHAPSLRDGVAHTMVRVRRNRECAKPRAPLRRDLDCGVSSYPAAGPALGESTCVDR